MFNISVKKEMHKDDEEKERMKEGKKGLNRDELPTVGAEKATFLVAVR